MKVEDLIFLRAGYKDTAPKAPDWNSSYSVDEVENLDSFGLSVPLGMFVVDIDDEAFIEPFEKIMFNNGLRLDWMKTTRGKHYYFKVKKNKRVKNSTNVMNKYGIKYDIRTSYIDPDTSLPKMSFLLWKEKGKPIREHDIDFEDLQEVPDFLLEYWNVKFDTFNIREGSRNDNLNQFKYFLQKQGFYHEETSSLVRSVNNGLENPLGEEEINSLLRVEESVFSKQKGLTRTNDKHQKNKKDFDYALFVHQLLDMGYWYNDNSYWFRGEHEIFFKEIDEESFRAKIWHMDKTFPKSMIDRILTNLSWECEENTFKYQLGKDDVVCENVILNLYTTKTQPLSREMNLTVHDKINIVYDATAGFKENEHTKKVDEFFNNISAKDKTVERQMKQIISYMLVEKNFLHKFFMLEGEGANGKSTFINLIKDIVGPQNTSALSLEAFDEQNNSSRFSMASLKNVKVNLCADLSDTVFKASGLLKRIVAGDAIAIEEKGKQQTASDRNRIINAKLIFSVNHTPRFIDNSSGMKRRLVIVPFLADMKNIKKDVDIEEKIKTEEAKSYLLNDIIPLYKMIRDNKCLIESEKSLEKSVEVETLNDPIVAFLEHYRIGKKELVCSNVYCADDLYREFRMYCAEEGEKTTMVRRMFISKICKKFNIKNSRIESGKIYFEEDN